jgi:ABC-type sugar transport system substrate-binding protein
MAASDEMAMGVLQAARRLGLRIPHDLSVIGIDDHVLSEVMDLTTMRQDLQAQGELAAEMLIRRMGDPTLPAEIVTAPTELVLRGTTGSPGPDRTDVENAWPTQDQPKRGEITDDQVPLGAGIPSASVLRSHNSGPLGGGAA